MAHHVGIEGKGIGIVDVSLYSTSYFSSSMGDCGAMRVFSNVSSISDMETIVALRCTRRNAILYEYF